MGGDARRANPRVLLLIGAIIVGTALFGGPGGSGLHGALSFLAGAGLAGLLMFGGIAAVALFASVPNGLSLMIALLTYVTTVGAFAAVLAVADPDVLDPAAFAAGLLVLGAAATTWQWRRSAVRPDGPRSAPSSGTGGPHGQDAS